MFEWRETLEFRAHDAEGAGEGNKILAVKPENLRRVCPAALPTQCSGLLVQGAPPQPKGCDGGAGWLAINLALEICWS